MFSLIRERDGAGDSGQLSCVFNVKEGKRVYLKNKVRPRVGYQIMVGSLYARSYQYQDWWQTSPVKEIIKKKKNSITFKTDSGSVYTWKRF